MRSLLLFIICIILFSCEEPYDLPNHVPGIVKVVDGKVFTTYGEGGLIISDDQTQAVIAQLFPPRGMHSIDDVDVDDDLIFILDTRGHDFVAVYSIENTKLSLVTPPINVQGGPFNGISASNGNMVVSGGTFFLERFTYSQNGDLNGPVTFGRDRGHPDVQLSEDGNFAFVSTDFSLEAKPRFGVLSLQLGNKLSLPTVVSELGIEGSGFSTGVTTPTGFPIKSVTTNDHLLVAHGNGLTFIPLTEGVFNEAYDLDVEMNCTAITINAGMAYLVGMANDGPTLVQVDITNINTPSIESTEKLLTSEIPTSIAVGENTIYVAVGKDGLLEVVKTNE